MGDGKLPERMAPVHALVAALPRPVAERLLAGVVSGRLTSAPSGTAPSCEGWRRGPLSR